MSRALALAVLLVAACRPPAPRLEVRHDPRIELLGTLRVLAGAPVSREERTFVEARFGRWRNHPAVAGLKALESRPGRAAPMGLIALFLEDPPELAWGPRRADMPEAFVEWAGGSPTLESWLASARDFARNSDFAGAYAERAVQRASIEGEIRAELGRDDHLRILEDYLGTSLDARLLLIPSLSFDATPSNSFVIPYPSREHGRVTGPMTVYTLLGPKQVSEGDWGLRRPPLNPVWNEPLYAALVYDLDVFDAAFAAAATPRRAAMDGSGCPPTPTACAKHLVVMAVARRLDARIFGEATPPEAGCAGVAVSALESELKSGYESAAHAPLATFLPRLAEVLAKPLCDADTKP